METLLLHRNELDVMDGKLFIPYASAKSLEKNYAKIICDNDEYLARSRDVTIIGCNRNSMEKFLEVEYSDGTTNTTF